MLLVKKRSRYRKTPVYEACQSCQKVEDGIEETLTYMDFLRSIGPGSGPITRLSVSTVRLNAVQSDRRFSDGQSALMLVCARLRHVAATSWGARRYMNMDHLFNPEEDQLSDIIAG